MAQVEERTWQAERRITEIGDEIARLVATEITEKSKLRPPLVNSMRCGGAGAEGAGAGFGAADRAG